MSVTVTNLIQGPAAGYYGTGYSETTAYTTTAEPADAAVNTTPQASAWTDMGGTTDGVNLEVGREFSELAVDQIIDVPTRRLTKREFTIATNVAEATLENFAVVSNDTAPTSGSGYKTFEPAFATSASQPTFRAWIFDGYAPQGFRRRVINRRMLSVDPIQFAYKKDGQTVFSMKLAGHYVSASIAPYKLIDQTS